MEWILSANILIIAIIISRRLLRGRVSSRVQYSLWLLAVLRLLIPVSLFHSSLNIVNLLPQSWVEQSVENLYHSCADGLYPESEADPYYQQTGNQSFRPAEMKPASQRDNSIAKDDSERIKKQSGIGNAAVAVGTVWLAGSCILALWLTTVNGVFRYRVRRTRRVQNIPGSLRRELSVVSGQPEDDRHIKQGRNSGAGRRRRKILPVYVTDRVGSPCMYGLFYPAVYITSQVSEDPWLLDMVLRHEMMHYRHGDHIWAAVRTLCLCIHWYNPLVWIAVTLSRQDGELACDESVLRQLGQENRSSYGKALLALSAGVKPTLPKVMNLATSMSGTKRQLKERLSALVTMPRRAAGTAILVMLLSLGLAVCSFTSRAEDKERDLPEGGAVLWKQPVSVKYSVGEDGMDSQGTEEADTSSKTEPEYGMEAASQPTAMISENQENPENMEGTRAVYARWDVDTLEYYDEKHRPVAEVTEGEMVTKLTYVETEWSLSAMEVQFSQEILYWACQALRELEQWTGTEVTEACYSVSEFGDFYFAQTPSDIQHSRVFYSRCYNSVSGLYNGSIENISYSTDMDVWYSPVKQYTTPPRYDKMTTEEVLTWYFERSAIAVGSKAEEIIRTEWGDYIIRTDQGTYYEFSSTDGIGTIGKGLSLHGPYDSYPQH